MGRIAFDQASGHLAEDLIWRFAVITDWEKSLEMGWVYGEWEGYETRHGVHDCPVDPAHETDLKWTEITITLCRGRWLPDFVALSNHGYEVASGDFIAKLRDSRLTGFESLGGVRILYNDSSIHQPKLYRFDVTGRAGFCKRWRVEDAPNLCPYCHIEPLLCNGCGWRSFFNCPNCENRVHHGGGYAVRPDGKSLRLVEDPRKLIVEGRDWDGSDLFCVRGHGGGWFANRRAKSWFDESHVVGVEFEPALLNVEGLEGRLPDGSAI